MIINVCLINHKYTRQWYYCVRSNEMRRSSLVLVNTHQIYARTCVIHTAKLIYFQNAELRMTLRIVVTTNVIIFRRVIPSGSKSPCANTTRG